MPQVASNLSKFKLPRKRNLDEDSKLNVQILAFTPQEHFKKRLIPTITLFPTFTTKYKGFIYFSRVKKVSSYGFHLSHNGVGTPSRHFEYVTRNCGRMPKKQKAQGLIIPLGPISNQTTRCCDALYKIG